MIAFLRGKVLNVASDHVIIDVNGVGYQVFIPASLAGHFSSIGKEVDLFTYFHVKEDQIQLFGFLDSGDKEIFKMLLEVEGIGPKLALGILSSVSKEELAQAIVEEKISLLTKLPGVGKKTAQRLVLELKDKIVKSNLITKFDKPSNQELEVYHDALQALLSLGYSQKEVEPVLQATLNAKGHNIAIDVLIKSVLQELGKNKE